MVTPDEEKAKAKEGTEGRYDPSAGPSADSRAPDPATVDIDLNGPLGSSRLGTFRSSEYAEPIEVRMPEEKVVPQAIPAQQRDLMEEKARRGLSFLRDIFEGRTDFRIDSDRMVGAELEFPLVDVKTGRPAFVADSVLQQLTDHGQSLKVVAELGKHNLELNLPPLAPTENFLSMMQAEINNLVARVNNEAEQHGAAALLCGILPSIRASDLSLENLFPGKPRYVGLNQTLLAEHGGNFDIEIRGQDRVDLRGSSIMAEALNTSFQLHFQVPYEEYTKFQHIADFIAGPTLAVAVNSPLVVGYRGPKESRVDVWAGSISDERVHLGGDTWMQDPLEQFERALKFDPLLETSPADSDVTELISWSKTVYPWNRTTPHVDPEEKEASIRIEGRPLPAGPTAIDCVANAAFFYGLMEGMGKALEREGVVLAEQVPFQDAKDNFRSAVDNGIHGQMTWIDGSKMETQTMLKEKLLPIAREGLESLGVHAKDIDKYLGVIEGRLKFGLAPADVLMLKEAELEPGCPDRFERMEKLTRWMIERASTHKPAHLWLGDTPPTMDSEDRPVH